MNVHHPQGVLSLYFAKVTSFIIQRRYLEQFNLLIFLSSEGNVPEFVPSGNIGFDSSHNPGPTSMFNEERA